MCSMARRCGVRGERSWVSSALMDAKSAGQEGWYSERWICMVGVGWGGCEVGGLVGGGVWSVSDGFLSFDGCWKWILF